MGTSDSSGFSAFGPAICAGAGKPERRLSEHPSLAAQARAAFSEDWQRLFVVALDERTCEIAAELAEATGARALDALHLAAAHRAGAPALRLMTFDMRLAQAARSMGWAVVGA